VDAAGRPLTISIPGLADAEFHYDSRGRLDHAQQGSRVWEYAYDDSGRVRTVTDPLSRVTEFRYDAADRLIRQVPPDLQPVGFTYDSNGNLKSLTPPGKPEHTFAYTAVDQTDRYTPPAAGLSDYETRYVYNRDHQLTHVKRPDSLNVTLGYDASTGQLTSVTTARGTSTLDYDPDTGQLLTLGSPDGITLTYGYDDALPTTEQW
jgi:YD repeat-containing protein